MKNSRLFSTFCHRSLNVSLENTSTEEKEEEEEREDGERRKDEEGKQQ